MRLPNGYGSVTKLSGKRRKPYMVRITEDCTYHEDTDDYTFMRSVFEHACQNDIISRDYTQYLKLEYSEPTYQREIFSKADVKYLWAHADEWDCQIMLILLYSGLRVNELLRNTAANVNPDERWIYVPDEL